MLSAFGHVGASNIVPTMGHDHESKSIIAGHGRWLAGRGQHKPATAAASQWPAAPAARGCGYNDTLESSSKPCNPHRRSPISSVLASPTAAPPNIPGGHPPSPEVLGVFAHSFEGAHPTHGVSNFCMAITYRLCDLWPWAHTGAVSGRGQSWPAVAMSGLAQPWPGPWPARSSGQPRPRDAKPRP